MFFLISIILGIHQPAKSHSWYPPECCSDKDCAPALAFFNKDGSITLTSIHGTATLPFDQKYKIQSSEDNDWHVCLIPDFDDGGPFREPKETGAYRVMCVFAPGVV